MSQIYLVLAQFEFIFHENDIETGAKKIALVFWAISGIRNGFTAFCLFAKLLIIKTAFQKGKVHLCNSIGSWDINQNSSS